MLLQAGMDAPQFELPDADMEIFSLEAQRRKKYRPVFLPERRHARLHHGGDEFTDLDDSFTRFDTLVVSVSRDECLSHAEFRDKYGLSVLLLSDKEARVCKKYGVLHGKEACTDRTTDETTSHSAMPPKNGDQAAGYSHRD